MAVGDVRKVDLAHGTIHYREYGDGAPVVFVHGLLVNADLWRNVVPTIAAAGYRCLAPDWPLGSHPEPMQPDTDLTPPGVADLIAEFLDALDLVDVTMVANDTGGALTQILMARYPERIGRVVLASCDGLDTFFPKPFSILPKLAALPGSIWLLAQTVRLRALHRLPMTFGWVAKRPIPPEVTDSYLLPSRRDPAIRRDLRKFLRGVHRRHTLKAAESFGGFNKPVLLVWAAEERLFPVAIARKLAAMLPDAHLTLVADAYTFIPEDQPAELARHILEFVKG